MTSRPPVPPLARRAVDRTPRWRTSDDARSPVVAVADGGGDVMGVVTVHRLLGGLLRRS